MRSSRVAGKFEQMPAHRLEAMRVDQSFVGDSAQRGRTAWPVETPD